MEVITPVWHAGANVRAFTTTRDGGVSAAPYDALNLGFHVGDDEQSVRANRRRVEAHFALPGPLVCPTQVHGSDLVDAVTLARDGAVTADAVYADAPGALCAILTADCLPILIASGNGGEVAAVHAGWRGLFDKVIESALARFTAAPRELDVWIGPGISRGAYRVDAAFRERFLQRNRADENAFHRDEDGWHADLSALAENRLRALGVCRISCYRGCTHAEARRFFSYRRDSGTGRMASVIWLREF